MELKDDNLIADVLNDYYKILMKWLVTINVDINSMF